MEEIRWIETPVCRACVPRPEFRRRYACLGCEKLRPRQGGQKRTGRKAKPAQRRYDAAQLEAVRRLRAAGYSYGRIAQQLALPRSTVQGIAGRVDAGELRGKEG